MSNKIKLEVEISLEDFFNSDAERDQVFKEALNESLLRSLNSHEFVQKNIAYYLFSHMKNEVFKSEMEKIEAAVRASIDEHKELGKWEVQSNDVFRSIINRALDDMSGDIYATTQKLAHEFTEDEGRDYNSLYGKVADAMVDKVFTHFVDAMVKKEEAKK